MLTSVLTEKAKNTGAEETLHQALSQKMERPGHSPYMPPVVGPRYIEVVELVPTVPNDLRLKFGLRGRTPAAQLH
jgi:hypothetical protein